jgi:chemotaxis protein CheD
MSSLVETTILMEKPMVGMGQIMIARAPQPLGSVLGSCVGIALFFSRTPIAALAHVVLPSSGGRSGAPGKFADTAVAEMLRLLACEGIAAKGIVAKLAGGSNMFGSAAQQLQIGEQNIAACKLALQQHGIPIVAEHLGGNQGRRVTLCSASGDYTIEIVGKPAVII